MTNTNSNILFSSGPLSVTSHMLRFHGRRYKLAHIENVLLKRPLLYMALAIAGLLIGAIIFNADILYIHESLIGIAAAILLAAASSPFGTLYIQSRTLSISGGSITWLHADLAKAQDVIEEILDRDGDEGGMKHE